MPADMNPHDLGKHFMALCNGSSDRQKEAFIEEIFNDHRTLQQQAFSMALRIVCGFANLDPHHEVDERNRYSYEQASNIVNFLVGDPMAKPETVVEREPWRVPLI